MSHRKQRKKFRKSAVALMMVVGGLAAAALTVSVSVYAQQPPPKGTIGTAGNAPGTINPGAPAGALNSYITPKGPSGGGQGTGAGGGGPGRFSCATGEHCPSDSNPPKGKVRKWEPPPAP